MALYDSFFARPTKRHAARGAMILYAPPKSSSTCIDPVRNWRACGRYCGHRSGWLAIMTKLVRNQGGVCQLALYKNDPTHVCFFSR